LATVNNVNIRPQAVWETAEDECRPQAVWETAVLA